MTTQDIANIRIAKAIGDSPFPLRNYLHDPAESRRLIQWVLEQNEDFFAVFTKNLRDWQALPLPPSLTSGNLAQCNLHPFAVGMAFHATIQQIEKQQEDKIPPQQQ